MVPAFPCSSFVDCSVCRSDLIDLSISMGQQEPIVNGSGGLTYSSLLSCARQSNRGHNGAQEGKRNWLGREQRIPNSCQYILLTMRIVLKKRHTDDNCSARLDCSFCCRSSRHKYFSRRVSKHSKLTESIGFGLGSEKSESACEIGN